MNLVLKDLEQWEKLNTVIGASCILLCDITSRPPRNSVQDEALPLPGAKGYILKQTNEMTVSELIRVSRRHKGEDDNLVGMETNVKGSCNWVHHTGTFLV